MNAMAECCVGGQWPPLRLNVYESLETVRRGRTPFRSGRRSPVCARLRNKRKLESQEDSTHLTRALRGNKV